MTEMQLTWWLTRWQVVSVSVNPVDPHLIMSAGNDHTARLSDIRVLSGGAASTSAPTPGASQFGQDGRTTWLCSRPEHNLWMHVARCCSGVQVPPLGCHATATV